VYFAKILFFLRKHAKYFVRSSIFFFFPRNYRMMRSVRSSRPNWPTGSCVSLSSFYLFSSLKAHKYSILILANYAISYKAPEGEEKEIKEKGKERKKKKKKRERMGGGGGGKQIQPRV
jgi:hypothetical protein